MERPFICKCLTAEYEEEKSVLRGPVHIQFDIGKEQLFHVDIEQAVIRSIKISTDSDVSIFDLNTVLSKIERLLMLLDGRFIQMKEMKFSESDVFSNDSLIPCAQNLIAQRSSYFCSADFCKNASYRLIDFENVFTPDLFSKWDDLLDELGVVHQMFLYSVSDSKITIDVKCAFLVELAEPIVEVVKERTYYFASLEPGSRGTTLKNCLDALIIKYTVLWELCYGERPAVHIAVVCGFWQGASGWAHPVFCFTLNLLTHGSRSHSSNIPLGHHSGSNRHSPVGHCK